MIINPDKTKITRPFFNDPTNRWLTDLSNEQHHSLPAISSSAIKYFYKKSPWAFYNKYVLRTCKSSEIKPEYRMGHLIHLAILEPGKFDKTVAICDEASNTTKFKEIRQEFLNSFRNEAQVVGIQEPEASTEPILLEGEGEVYKEARKLSDQIKEAKKKRNTKKSKHEITQSLTLPEGFEIIKDRIIEITYTKDMEVRPSKNGGYYINDQGDEVYFVKSHEMDMLRKIQNNCFEHPRISLMLPRCQYIEQSGIAQCPKTGLFLSVRGDARSDDGFFFDPKSIASLSLHAMQNSQASFQYFLQHVHYLYVANLIEPDKYDRFYFLYVDKEDPYEVCITHLEQDDIEKAQRCYFKILQDISRCEKLQKWPTLDGGNGLKISIPPWAFKNE